jgi:hypothetical protein
VDLTFAIWICAVPLLFHNRLLNGDGDLARHLVIGRHILSNGPRFRDPFSFSRAGEPFLAYEWLSQVTYALVHSLAGLPGILLLAGVIIAATLALVVQYVRRAGGDSWLAFLTGMAAAVLMGSHWIARPHLFSFVALAVLLNVLRAPRPAVLVVPVFVVWANLHPGFLYGLVMLALWGAGRAIEDVRSSISWPQAVRTRIAPFIAATAATLLNPFGWNLHAHSLALLRSDSAALVHEFMPFSVLDPYGLTFLTICGLVVAGMSARRDWVGWDVMLVFGAGVVASLAARRYAPVFAVFALPIAAAALGPTVSALPRWFLGAMRAEFARSDVPRSIAGPIVTAAMVLFLAADGRLWSRTILPVTFSADVFPERAIQAARAAGLDGRLLSEYMWGGYVLYTWPGQRVFVDSMADFFGDELIDEYLRLAAAHGDWEGLMRRRDISLVLFPPTTRIVQELKQRSGWRVVYEDSVAVLLTRETSNSPVAPAGQLIPAS